MGCCESCLRSVGLLGGNEHTSDEETTPLIRSNTQIPAPTKSTVSKIDTTKAYQEVIEDAQE